MITRLGRTADTAGILDLQARNLYANLSEEDRGDGFVTTPFSPELIQDFVAADGVFVAEDADRIVGYAFAGPWRLFDHWPIFPVMTARFPGLRFADQALTRENTFEYGPICLDRSVRGSGLLPQLFATVCATFAPQPLIGTTFINRRNERSMRAHTLKLGLTVIDHFEFNDQSYATLAFSTQPDAQ
jgi:hypothetical protein